MEPEGLLLCSQEPATGPYTEPDKASRQGDKKVLNWHSDNMKWQIEYFYALKIMTF